MRIALALVGVLALVATGYGLTFTPIFHARDLVVVGSERVDDEHVLRAARFTERTNVVHADLTGAEQRVAGLPWVREARIDRELPGTLVVTVWERVPVATLGARASRLVTRDGAILVGSSAARLPAVVALVGVPRPEAVSGAARALASMSRSLYRAVEEVVVVPGGSLLVRMRSGLIVEWGSAAESAEKAQALAAVLAWAERSGDPLTAIDVTVPQAPRATPRTG